MVQILDGDNIRSGINSNLSFSEEDRRENIRRIAEVSKLFLNCGIIAINSFISPTREVRHIAREIIGKENFLEVFINAPLDICEQRDVKGLYARARKGEIKDFTGIGAPFEVPIDADLEIRTDLLTIEESVKKLLDFLLPRIQPAVSGQQSAVSGRWSAVGGQLSAVGGQRSVVGAQQSKTDNEEPIPNTQYPRTNTQEPIPKNQ